MSRALAERGLGDLGPLPQDALRLLQRADRVGHQAVVRERDLGRVASHELAQRGDRQLEVEVGRGRRRPQHAGVGKAHSHGVAHEQDAAQRVVQREVVLRVAGRVDGREGARRRSPAPLRRRRARGCARARWARAARRASRAVAVDHRRRTHEPLRGRRDGALPSRARRSSPSGNAFATSPTPPAWSRWMCVTATPARSFGPMPELVERGEQHRHRALAPGLDEHRRVALHEVAGSHPVPSAEQRVDLDHSVTDSRVHVGVLPGVSAVSRAAVARGQYGGTP